MLFRSDSASGESAVPDSAQGRRRECQPGDACAAGESTVAYGGDAVAEGDILKRRTSGKSALRHLGREKAHRGELVAALEDSGSDGSDSGGNGCFCQARARRESSRSDILHSGGDGQRCQGRPGKGAVADRRQLRGENYSRSFQSGKRHTRQFAGAAC